MKLPLVTLALTSAALAGAVGLCPARAEEGDVHYKPSAENLEARRWFEDARFGLFVHWGVYSVLGDGEWVMENRKMGIAEYERLPSMFNPTAFKPAEWVALAKEAGMKYITITSKHHDGFAMFDSKVSNWDVVDRTPFKKDPLKMLANECRRQGLKLFFYYSQLDWHHPDYYPRGRTGHMAGRPEHGDFNKYVDYMNSQLSELLTNYGPVGGIWFDGWWDRKEQPWRLGDTYSLIHRLQPAALIGANHHRIPFVGEDFQMFEKDLPGGNSHGWRDDVSVSQLPLETCETINGAWGYNVTDHAYKTPKQLIDYLVKAAGSNANFLLNVGPTPEGRIQPEFAERLRTVGAWLKTYGQSVYGTRGGPIPPRPWGVTTRKGNTIFVHILDWPDGTLSLPGLAGKVRAARALKGGAPIRHHEVGGDLIIEIPAAARDPHDTVIALETS